MGDGLKELSDRQKVRESLDWIRDLKQKDVDRIMRAQSSKGDDLSMKMIYEDCGGIETCILLWLRLSRMTLHVSVRPLNALRQLYIWQNFKADDPERNAKSLAAILNCSEQFVREALTAKSKADEVKDKVTLKE